MDDTSAKTTCSDLPEKAAAHYDQFLGPLFFEPYAIEVARRIDPLSVCAALEIAAGTGRLTRHIREVLLPAAKLVASDINPDMLAQAKKEIGSS